MIVSYIHTEEKKGSPESQNVSTVTKNTNLDTRQEVNNKHAIVFPLAIIRHAVY